MAYRALGNLLHSMHGCHWNLELTVEHFAHSSKCQDLGD